MKTKKIRESKAHRFFSGRGFYMALALSLVALGSAAWFGVNSAMRSLENAKPQTEENSVTQNSYEWSVPSDRQAAAPQSNVTAQNSAPKAAQNPDKGYQMPVSGPLLNAYSGDKMVKSKTLNDWVMHTGVDIEAKPNTPVKAIASGKVSSIKNDSMWGTVVTISHKNGIESSYSGLKSATGVSMGQTVRQGDVIGYVANKIPIEQAEKCHLHFSIRKNGEWVNPLDVINKAS